MCRVACKAWLDTDELDALVRAASPPALDIPQRDLPEDAAMVLRENLPDLYVDTDVVRGRVDGAAGGVRSAGLPQEKAMDDVPRRNRLDHCTPAELAIYHAMEAVEALPADERLTAAVTWLQKAREKVADFVDGVPLLSQNEQEAAARWRDNYFAAVRGDAARVPPSQDSPERLLADWRAQDAALAEIWDELGIDRHVGPSDPAEIAQLTIEALRAASVPPATPEGWQPIETAPKDGTWILVVISSGVKMSAFDPEAQRWKQSGGGFFGVCPPYHEQKGFDSRPTHWMPLPAAPATPQEK